MATSSHFSLASQSMKSSLRFNGGHKSSHPPISPTTSLLVSHKSLCPPPLRYNNDNGSGISGGIGMKRKTTRLGSRISVKASMKTNKNVEVLNKDHLAVSLAKYVSDLSDQFIKHKDCFTIVLSAHSIKYLRKLVEPPYINTIEWSKWHVFWVDKKVVPKTHVESNYKFAYDRFICKVPIPRSNINAIDDALPGDGVADVYETSLRLLVKSNVVGLTATGLPKFDLILLDMGPDGHVGSLFPKHPALKEKTKWVTFINDASNPPRHRITLTLPVINAGSNIAMVVTGAAKADLVYNAVMEKYDSEGSNEKLPIHLISPEGNMKWFLDKGAASKLYII